MTSCMTLRIGQNGKVQRRVTDALSAHTLGNPDINVLATPCLAGICDRAAAVACGTEVRTRRMRVDIRHLAATPVGDEIEIFAEIASIRESRVICSVTGRDSTGDIVSGTVERVIV
jgi:fluoroacetyl-CoA thioesterase